MEGDRKRKTYDKEFKLDAVRLIVEEGRSVASVARDLGVNENSLHHWKKKYVDFQHRFPIYPPKSGSVPCCNVRILGCKGRISSR